jgi:chromosome segregation ATPase
MTEEWLTYREIGARLGLNVEAVRTRVRRAGWRTQPGNDGRTRVLVPVEAVVEPVRPDDEGVNDRVNRTGDLTGLVALLTATEARVSRLERQLEAERDRVNEARSETDRLRGELAQQTAQTDRAKQASTEAEQAARIATDALDAARQAAERRIASLEAEATAKVTQVRAEVDAARVSLEAETEAKVAQAQADAERARGVAQEAVQAAEALQTTIDGLKAGQGRHAGELEQARTEAQEAQQAAEAHITNLEADAAAKDAWIAQAEVDLDVARRDAETARQAAAESRLADTARKARGRLRRAWDGWRGR